MDRILHTQESAEIHYESRTGRLMQFLRRIAESKAISAVAAFCAGFLLTKTIIFGEYAPFGVAFVAASRKRYGFAAAMGAILGYFMAPHGIDGLKYMAAAILCMASWLIFRDIDAIRYRVFMPIVTAVSLAGVGFVFILEKGVDLTLAALFFSEIALAVSATWFYEGALSGPFSKHEESENKLILPLNQVILGFSALCAFSGITFGGILSPVRAFTMLFILCSARVGGAGIGAATGLLTGALMDMRGGGLPFFSMAYGLAALFSGLFSKKDKLLFIVMFLMTGATSAAWGMGTGIGLSILYEGFIASVLFFLMPARWAEPRQDRASQVSVTEYAKQLRSYTGHQINRIAMAFMEIYQTLSVNMDVSVRKNDENIRVVFDYAAEKVCCKCAIRGSCWEKDYVTTFTALNDTSAAILKNGQVEKSDFPSYFASRCLRFPDFIQAVNDAAETLMQRRQHKARMRENGDVIKEQYAGVAGLLHKMAVDMEASPEILISEEMQVEALARPYCGECDVSVLRTNGRHLLVRIEGEDLSPIIQHREKFMATLTKTLDARFALPEQIVSDEGWIITLREAEILAATVGVGVHKKHGEEVSGDSGTYFKTEDGMVHMMLSDGMGTGRGAAVASSAALKMIERFLRSGVSPKEALQAAWPALKLKSDERGFATLDIFSLDLFSGCCEFLKYGAAPSYVRKKDGVHRIQGGGLPPGVSYHMGSEPDLYESQLAAGDFAVLLSDGITGSKSDAWLHDAILSYQGSSPKELAHQILEGVLADGKADDDMTALVIHIRERN